MTFLEKTLLNLTLSISFLFSCNSISAQDTTHLYFDGENDYIETVSLGLNSVYDDFTFEAIIKGNEEYQGNNPTILSNRLSHIQGIQFYLKGNGAGDRLLCVSNDAAEFYIPGNGTFGGSLLDGECHHVAIVRQGNYLYFYADGILFGVDEYFGCDYLGTSHTTWIGRDPYYGSEFQGVIAKVRIWSEARSASEIYDNMHASMTGTEPFLVNCWELNDGNDTQTVFEKKDAVSFAHLGPNYVPDGSDPNWFPGSYCDYIEDYGDGEDDPEAEDDPDDSGDEDEEDDGDGTGTDSTDTAHLNSNSPERDFTIFPNPSKSNVININFSDEFNNVSLSIMDLNGKTISQTNYAQTNFLTLDITHLSNGIYFIVLEYDGGFATQKLIVR